MRGLARLRRAAPLPILAVAMALSACASAPKSQTLLREYRITLPRDGLAAPSWLVAFAGDDLAARLSPDGRRLVYASNHKGQFDIWVKDLTTGLPRRITRHSAEDTQPDWSPDGKSVVFVSMRKDAKGDLYLWRKGDPRRLTDAGSADRYPVFAADGKAIYYAGGEAGRPRIYRLTLSDGSQQPMGAPGSTHPAVSADGRYLAYTWFDGHGRGRIVLQRIADEKRWTVTTPDYQAGFPTFSPDGRHLAFSRFYRGPPRQPREPTAPASLWRVAIAPVVWGTPPPTLMAAAEQLTSDRRDILLPRWHRRGIVFSARTTEGFDVGLLPPNGCVPPAMTAAARLRLAKTEPDPWEQLLALRSLYRDPTLGAEARYRSARIWIELGEFSKARRALDRVASSVEDKRPVAAKRDHAALARIDRIVLAVEQLQRAEQPAGQVSTLARQAIAKLDHFESRWPGRASAHLLLRKGDMQRAARQIPQAIASYRRIITDYGDHRALAAEARLRLGTLFSTIDAPDLVNRYYFTLFDLHGDDDVLLRRVAQAIVDQYQNLPAREQVQRLAGLLERHGKRTAFALVAYRRLAELYEQNDEIELALDALQRLLQRQRRTDALATAAAFDQGRLSLRRSRELRQEGRHSDALIFYDRAVNAYERIVRDHDPASEVYQRARREFLRISLLDAAQLSRQSDVALAQKRYERIIAFDDSVLQAHRALVDLRRSGHKDLSTFTQRYAERLRRDGGDFVGHYMLGYLATLHDPLRPKDLARAERHLRAAMALRPRNPFPYLTLGWVFEMRERYFGERFRGWLEEAKLHYERAYGLNDAVLDPQTEADLLINLVNAFVGLGTGWKDVLGFCQRRRTLGYPFRSREQEAVHRLSCARAASARGQYDQAAEQLEAALRLARALRHEALEVEVIARTGLNEHLRGKFHASSRWLRQASKLLQQSEQTTAITAIERTIAYNTILAGDIDTLEPIEKAQRSLSRFGGANIGPIMLVAASLAPSTAPLGFDTTTEHYAERALREIVAERNLSTRRARRLHQERIALQRQRIAANDFVELRRELLVLQNRAALTMLSLDDPAASTAQMRRLRTTARELESHEGELDGESFVIEVVAALNHAEHLLSRQASARAASSEQLVDAYRWLARLEDWRQEAPAPLLSERLRLALLTDLALLQLRLPLRAPAHVAAAPAKRSVSDQLRRWMRWGAPRMRALALLRQVADETAPDVTPVEPEDVSDRRRFGPAAALWRPLRAMERIRWHTMAVLNLARASSAGVSQEQLATHASTTLLTELAHHVVTHDLGALRFVLSAELAYRRDDLQAMRAVVDAMIERHPLLLGAEYLVNARQLRDTLFERAMGLALNSGAPDAALRFAELRDRRAFVDELLTAGPRAIGPAKPLLETLLEAARTYRKHYRTQNTTGDEQSRIAWAERLGALERTVRAKLAAVEALAPVVAGLLRVGKLEITTLQQALAPNEVAVRILAANDAVALVAVSSEGPSTLRRLTAPLTSLLEHNPSSIAGLLQRLMGPMVGKATRVYVDRGPLELALGDTPLTLAKRRTLDAATLWELVDARRVRIPLDGRRVAIASTAADPLTSALARDAAFEPIGSLGASSQAIEGALDDAGVLLIAPVLRFDGGPATNLVIERAGGAQPWKLARMLGATLRVPLVVLADVQLSPGQRRTQRIALTRLLHAAGTPNVLLLEQPGATVAGRARALKRWLDAATKQGLADARPPPSARLYGAISDDQSEEQARQRLRQLVVGGAAAFRATPRRLAATVTQLEPALRYMRALDDRRYLGGALKFLAGAYGLQGNFAPAIRRMKGLVELRRIEFTTARAKEGDSTARLKAKANYVGALRHMASLRLRNDEFDAALAVNAQTIAIYKEIGRSALLRQAYDQRSIIAEEKGDYPQALRYAELAFSPPGARGRKRSAPAVAALEPAKRALRIATLLRLRFSRYDDALRRIRQALAMLPPPDAASVRRLRTTLAQPATNATPAAAKQRGAGQRSLQQMEQVASERAETLLELARVQHARGLYRAAVETARRARLSLQQAGLPEQVATLEEGNNLYFLGSYREALRTARHGLALCKDDPRRRIQFLNLRGIVLGALTRYDEARRALSEALRLARRERVDHEVAATLNNIGHTYRLARRYGEARRSFSQALSLDERRADTFGISTALANRGLTNAALGLDEEAIADLERARALSERIDAAHGQLKALAGLGPIALKQGDAQRALEHAQRGLAIATKLDLRRWAWRFLLQIGKAQKQLGQHKAAKDALMAGVALIDEQPPRLGARPATDEGGPVELYDALIDLLVGQGEAEAALQVVERLHARQFVDRLSGELLRIDWPQARELAEQLVDLQSEIEGTRTLAEASVAATPEGAARDEVPAALRQRLVAARDALAKLNPRLERVLLPEPRPLSEAQTALGALPDSAAISYYATPTRLAIWIVDGKTPARVQMEVVPITRRRLQDAVARLTHRLSNFAAYREVARELHSWLAAPVLSRTEARHWFVIVPDFLRTLPLAVLDDGREALVDRVRLTYLQALSSLGGSSPTTGGGSPVEWKERQWISFNRPGTKAEPLTLAVRESVVLGQTFDQVRVFGDEEATKAHLLNAAPKARQLHVATHARRDGESPFGTALQLGGELVRGRDILGTRLRARLVVLSACGTARWADPRRESGGLHEAFLLAGAKQVLAAAWHVSDLGAALLMKHFFRQMRTGLSPAQALQQAKLALRARYPHPAFWAPFRLHAH